MLARHRLTSLLLAVCLAPAVIGDLRGDDIKDDGGLWLMALAQGSLGVFHPKLESYLFWMDNQARFTDDADGFTQSLVRPGLGYAIAENLSGWLGYAWIHTEPASGGTTDEDRIWEQVILTGKLEPVSLQSRTRLEQRFISGRSDVGWRFREFVKLDYPFFFEPRLGLAIYDEVFIDLNDTDWGADAGFAQNRAFGGFAWKFDPKWHTKVEVGYLNQFIRNRSGFDRMNHILSFNFFFNF